jgi:hypothetical protein
MPKEYTIGQSMIHVSRALGMITENVQINKVYLAGQISQTSPLTRCRIDKAGYNEHGKAIRVF